jgi:CubicO group peptidase (beta-lactamase class C family)
LLTHTSSLRDAAGYSWPNERALKDILVPGGPFYGKGEAWSDRAAAGDFFTYTNLNWSVIGTIMERVTGERFDRLMRRLVLDPLGIHGGYNPSEFPPEDLAKVATLYRKRTTDTEVWDANGPWIAQVDDYATTPPARPMGIDKYVIGTNASPFSPTGGLRISAPDMGKIMLMLINHGRHDGKQFIKPETLARMFTRQWTYDGKGGNGDSNDGLFYAWGIGNQQFLDEPGTGRQVVEGGGFSGVGHLGDAYGLMSVFMVDLAKGNGMIALVGGTSTDPLKYVAKNSSLARFQEQILTAMYQRAILGKAT